MICVYANASVKNGCEENFLKIAQVLINHSRAEAGNISYHLAKESENHYVFMELWTSENALEEHMNTPHFQKAGEDLEPVLTQGLDIHKMEGVF